MRDISNITGQALPSSAKLLWSTFIALFVAILLLVIAVLPAEYGIDPTGLGKKMGLTALYQPGSDQADDQNTQSEQYVVSETDEHSHDGMHTHQHGGEQATAHSHDDMSSDGVLQKRAKKWRSDSLKFVLQPKQGMEIKVLIDENERLLFNWMASGAVSFDLHGNVVGAAEDEYTSFWLAEGETQSAGSFEAPFSGLHGWYWENESDQPVNIALELEGYYRDLAQH